jgi:hypothetical protein
MQHDTPLRRFAAGKPCYLRLVGICNRDDATTVLAHIRRGGLGGTGYKPSDLAALPACSSCHAAYDGGVQAGMTRTELDAEALRGLVQWLDWLHRQEVVNVCLT